MSTPVKTKVVAFRVSEQDFTTLAELASRLHQTGEFKTPNPNILAKEGPVALIMDHFLRESHEFQSIQITRQEYESFRELVAEIITNEMNQYIRSTQDRRRARELYDDLFQISIRSNSKFRNAMGGDAFGAFNIVATTNYDLVLEIYGNESNLPGVHRVLTERGFLREPGIDALNMVGMRERTIDLSYIKLHGSIDWWHTAEGKIILNMGSENPYQVLTDRTTVYPIYEVYPT